MMHDAQINTPTIGNFLPRSNEHIVQNENYGKPVHLDPRNMDIYNPASTNYGMTEDEYWNTQKDIVTQ
jgi:hypothetical protein